MFSEKGVSLRTVAGSLHKTSIPGHVTRPFFIPSLTAYSGRGNNDRLLCPVRLPKFYLTATDGYQPGNRLLHKLNGDTTVSAQTISVWMVHCIHSMVDDPTIHASAHEFRRLAASWAYVSGVHCLDDILLAGIWAAHTIFSLFYMIDVQAQLDFAYAQSWQVWPREPIIVEFVN